ncbi:MAG: DUF2914 domain-containing protein [Nitrosomonas sp.]|nr:DUF2914 domain-containing protein [Nitrosomonas sp.]MDP1951650.1 DUF2914 domain-containing protein [Nitrosomonas sp.]
MKDQQIKIRIQLTQPPLPIEQQYLEPMTQVVDDQPPFDWRKISLALLFVVSLFSLVSYALFAGRDDKALFAETVPPVDQAATRDENTILPMDFQTEVAFVEAPIEYPEKSSESDNIIVMESISAAEPATEIGISSGTDPAVAADALVVADETTVSTIASVVKDQPQVVRAQLSHAIQRREPVDRVDHIALNRGTSEFIYFFMHLRGLEGRKVTVHWYYQDKEVSKIELIIGHQNWRTNASKRLTQKRLGAWHVELQDDSGKLLAQRNFTVSNRP